MSGPSGAGAVAPRHGRRRWLVAAAWLGSLVIALGAGWWAAKILSAPPPDPAPAASTALYVVEDGEVGRVQSFIGQAEWVLQPALRAPVSGVVTTLDVAGGSEVRSGQQLLTIDLRPVVVVLGAVPAFRDLAVGVNGEDVAQLQGFLAAEGYLEAPADGEFGRATAAAVRGWQKAVGFPDDGVVHLGDVVFLSDLPTRITWAEQVAVGVTVTAGELLASSLRGQEPEIKVTLGSDQLAVVSQTGEVVVHSSDRTWPGVITDSVNGPDGTVVLTLSAADGSSICGAECAEVFPVPGPVNLGVDFVVVPATTGPVVPVSAIQTLANGDTVVTLEDESQVSVTVRAAADGLAVVDGVGPGDSIVIPTTGE